MSMCKACIFDCGVKNIEKCNGFMHKVTEEERLEILEQIREQNMSIPVFCRDNHLKSQYVKKMISGKLEYTYKIYTLIMDRLLEEEEWVEFMKKHPTGLNEDNHFYEDSLVV